MFNIVWTFSFRWIDLHGINNNSDNIITRILLNYTYHPAIVFLADIHQFRRNSGCPITHFDIAIPVYRALFRRDSCDMTVLRATNFRHE